MKLGKIKKLLIAAVCVSFISFGFTSCMDPIFSYINEEVALEKSLINGSIYSIVRFQDEIFVANGLIYHKPKDSQGHGQWELYSKPNGHVLTIAADKDNLYALCIYVGRNDSEGEMEVVSKKLYSFNPNDPEGWKEIRDIGRNATALLMSTNSTNEEHRKAYINISGIGYELGRNGLTPNPDANNSRSCAYLQDKTKFYSGPAACSNNGDTIVYYASGASVIKDDGKNQQTISSGVRTTIYGLAVMEDSILINTSAGSALIDIKSGIEISFGNLTSTLSSLYETLACIATEPSQKAKDTIIYSSIAVIGTGSNSALFSHEGLWSYYPNRGKWNAE